MVNPFREALKAEDGSSRKSTGPGSANPFKVALEKEDADPGALLGLAQGFNRGLGALAELPSRIAHPLLEPLARNVVDFFTGEESEPMSFDQQKQAKMDMGAFMPYSRMVAGYPEAVKPLTKITSAAGESLAYNAPIMAATSGFGAAAPMASRALAPGALTTMQVLQRGLAEAPLVGPLMEGMSALGAGAGGEAARQVAPGSTAAEVAGEIIGGLTPVGMTVGPARLGYEGGRFLWSRLNPKVQADRAAKSVGDTFESVMTPRVRENLTEADAIQQKIPGIEYSLAESTGAPSLLNTQRQIEGGAFGPELDSFGARRDANMEAIDTYRGSVAPEASKATMEDVVQGAFDVPRGQIADVQTEMGNVEMGLARNADALPLLTKDQTGDALRTNLLGREKVVQKEMKKLAQDLGLNDVDLTADFRPFRDRIRENYSEISPFAPKSYSPEVVEQVVSFGTRTDDATRMLLKDIRSGMKNPPKSLVQYIKENGGLKLSDEGAEMVDMPKGLLREDGRSWDDMALKATEDGYFPETGGAMRGGRATIDDLKEAIDMETRGFPRYSEIDDAAVERLRQVDRMRREMDMAGIDVNLPDDEVVRRLNFVEGNTNGPVVTFEDAKMLRENLGKQIRDEAASANTDARKLSTLKAMQKELDRFINTAFDEKQPGLAQNYRDFRSQYLERYIMPYERGASYSTTRGAARGGFRTQDEDVAKAFWKPGKVDPIKQYKQVFGEDPDALQALHDIALDDLRRTAVKDNQINDALMATWMRKHEENLKELPGLAAKVRDIESANKALRDRQGSLTERKQQIEGDMLNRDLQAYEKGAVGSPDDIVKRALKDPRKAKKLVARLKDKPELLKALRRKVWDDASALDRTPEQMIKFMDTNAESLDVILGKEMLDNLRTIVKATEIAQRVPKPTGGAMDTNPFSGVEGALGTGLNQIASRAFAAESGRTSWRYVATDIFMRAVRGFSRREADSLFKSALYDPQVARDLAKLVIRPDYKPGTLLRRLHSYLIVSGVVPESQDR